MGWKDDLKEYIHKNRHKFEEHYKKSNIKEVKFDLKEMDSWEPELINTFREHPSKFLDTFSDLIPFADGVNLTPFNPPSYLSLTIEDIQGRHIENVIVIEGNVRKKYQRMVEIVKTTFKCLNCGNTIVKEQSNGELKRPYKCNCGSRKMKELTHKRNYENFAKIVVESTIEQSTSTVPKRLQMELRGHLASKEKYNLFKSGDRVKIIGVIRPRKVKKKSMKRKPYLQVLNVTPTKEEFEKLEITEEEIEEIKSLSDHDDILGKFAHSISPEIYGRDTIKRALALQLFGGFQKGHIDKGNYHRGDIHILLIGDPGTSKSKLLSYVSGIAPKSRYLSGGSVTSSGLTSTAVKEDDNWTLEAGSMSLTNKGVLCLDEIDALDKSELKRLNEAMERQTISVSKAAVDSTLETKTTVLAAGNPKLDRFDPYKPMSEQITIPHTLLSRFDLIFPLKDEPEEEKDENIVDNIFGGSDEVITEDIVKKYIAYSRRNVKPEMTEKAKEKIKKFYVEVRSSSGEDDPVPLTARQIHSLRRLAEASARMRLSDKVEEQDAQNSLNLVKDFLKKVGIDPDTGEYDIDVIEGRTSHSKRNKMRAVLDMVKKEVEDMDGQPAAEQDVIARAGEKGISDPEQIIESLKRQGEVFAPKSGYLKVI